MITMINVNFLELVEPEEQPKLEFKPSGAVMPGEIVKFNYDENGDLSTQHLDARGRLPWRRK